MGKMVSLKMKGIMKSKEKDLAYQSLSRILQYAAQRDRKQGNNEELIKYISNHLKTEIEYSPSEGKYHLRFSLGRRIVHEIPMERGLITMKGKGAVVLTHATEAKTPEEAFRKVFPEALDEIFEAYERAGGKILDKKAVKEQITENLVKRLREEERKAREREVAKKEVVEEKKKKKKVKKVEREEAKIVTPELAKKIRMWKKLVASDLEKGLKSLKEVLNNQKKYIERVEGQVNMLEGLRRNLNAMLKGGPKKKRIREELKKMVVGSITEALEKATPNRLRDWARKVKSREVKDYLNQLANYKQKIDELKLLEEKLVKAKAEKEYLENYIAQVEKLVLKSKKMRKAAIQKSLEKKLERAGYRRKRK